MAKQRGLADMIGEDIEHFVRRLNETQPEKKAAETAKRIMIRRTREAGRDKQGRFFRRYAPNTIVIKRRKGQQVSPVNLSGTGNMLDRLKAAQPEGHQAYTVHGGRTRRVAVIKAGTKEDERKIRFHVKGTKRMPQRDFFGLSSREERAVGNQFKTDIDRCLPPDRRRRVMIRVFR